MVPDQFIRVGGRIAVIGFDSALGRDIAIAIRRRLGPNTGEEIVEVVPVQVIEPPKIVAPEIPEPEPPPRKKSWRQQQKELPKFLR